MKDEEITIPLDNIMRLRIYRNEVPENAYEQYMNSVNSEVISEGTEDEHILFYTVRISK